MYPYLYQVKLFVNEIDYLVDDFHLLVQVEQESIHEGCEGFIGILVI
jgi:hypothetical protein